MSKKFIEFGGKQIQKRHIVYVYRYEYKEESNRFYISIALRRIEWPCESYSYEDARDQRFNEIMKLLEE